MNYIIRDEINILYEINKAFMHLAHEYEELEWLNECLSKIAIDNEKYKKNNLKGFYKFIEKFKKINTIPQDDIKFYFSDINDGVTVCYLGYKFQELINLSKGKKEEINKICNLLQKTF